MISFLDYFVIPSAVYRMGFLVLILALKLIYYSLLKVNLLKRFGIMNTPIHRVISPTRKLSPLGLKNLHRKRLGGTIEKKLNLLGKFLFR
jgi:hypothetical protein